MDRVGCDVQFIQFIHLIAHKSCLDRTGQYVLCAVHDVMQVLIAVALVVWCDLDEVIYGKTLSHT